MRISTGKQWIAYSGWGVSPCPMWRSSSTSGFCSRVRSIGESEQRVRCCMSFTVRLWRKGSWARRQSPRSTNQSSFLPSPVVMSKRTRSRVQAAEMGFLRRVAGVSLRDRVRSSAIWEGLGVELLLLLHGKEPVEVIRASDEDATRAPS